MKTLKKQPSKHAGLNLPVLLTVTGLVISGFIGSPANADNGCANLVVDKVGVEAEGGDYNDNGGDAKANARIMAMIAARKKAEVEAEAEFATKTCQPGCVPVGQVFKTSDNKDPNDPNGGDYPITEEKAGKGPKADWVVACIIRLRDAGNSLDAAKGICCDKYTQNRFPYYDIEKTKGNAHIEQACVPEDNKKTLAIEGMTVLEMLELGETQVQ